MSRRVSDGTGRKKNSIIRPQNTKNAGKETRIHKTRERWKETVASKESGWPSTVLETR